MYYRLLITFFLPLFSFFCTPQQQQAAATVSEEMIEEIIPGAENVEEYLPSLKGKSIALLVNHTSTIQGEHTADRLLKEGIDIKVIFSPEHGFRGTADAGEKIADGKDPQTGVQVVSLYGKKRKPDPKDLEGIDLVVFDIQDVGTRFYTYISTMSLAMEACAENDVPFLVLDRPNPNAHYIDGPILEEEFSSFVGMHPVPVVYGLTIGEYAMMVNGEGWLASGIQCDLEVVPCKNYSHDMMYELPIKPSPNLPNLRSVLLYPSLCFFEGTPISIGRGTQTQFQVIGHPDLADQSYSFTPSPQDGAAHPKLNGELSHGLDLTKISPEEVFAEKQINIDLVLQAYEAFPNKSEFFNKNGWFDKLSGTTSFREMIQAGKSAAEIREAWSADLTDYDMKRKKYLLYK